jgi:hypothetical protein
MLYLPHPSSEILESYQKLIENAVKTNIETARSDGALNVEALEFLEKHLPEIIKSEPAYLKNLNREFFTLLYIGLLTPENYQRYCRLSLISADRRSAEDKSFIPEYEKELLKINEVFDYKKILTKSKSYWLAKKLKTNTCIYCNRLYANTIEIEGGTNNEKRIARPTFDHWYSKSKHPILALSFFNLIPSCSVCNTSIKSTAEFDIDTHIHPYIHDKTDQYNFSYIISDVGEYEVSIKDFDILSQKAKNTIMDFKIREVFSSHSDKELKDILDLQYKYSPNYLKELFQNSFTNLVADEKEIYRLIFGTGSTPEEYHTRPFSKFKNDIIEEIRKSEDAVSISNKNST